MIDSVSLCVEGDKSHGWETDYVVSVCPSLLIQLIVLIGFLRNLKLYFGGLDTLQQHSQFFTTWYCSKLTRWCRSEGQYPVTKLACLHQPVVEASEGDQFTALRISDVDTPEALAFEVAAPLVEWDVKCCMSIPARGMTAFSQLPIVQSLTGLWGGDPSHSV